MASILKHKKYAPSKNKLTIIESFLSNTVHAESNGEVLKPKN